MSCDGGHAVSCSTSRIASASQGARFLPLVGGHTAAKLDQGGAIDDALPVSSAASHMARSRGVHPKMLSWLPCADQCASCLNGISRNYNVPRLWSGGAATLSRVISGREKRAHPMADATLARALLARGTCNTPSSDRAHPSPMRVVACLRAAYRAAAPLWRGSGLSA